jgi:hypothetical protein
MSKYGLVVLSSTFTLVTLIQKVSIYTLLYNKDESSILTEEEVESIRLLFQLADSANHARYNGRPLVFRGF